EIYQVHSRRAPANSSVAAEHDFVQDIARRKIGAILATGESLIYDDLLLQREERRKLAAVAEAHWADLVFVYLDTPLPVLDARREQGEPAQARPVERVAGAGAVVVEGVGDAGEPVGNHLGLVGGDRGGRHSFSARLPVGSIPTR